MSFRSLLRIRRGSISLDKSRGSEKWVDVLVDYFFVKLTKLLEKLKW